MDQKPLRTLLVWTIWAAIASVGFLTIYRDTDVWAYVQHDNSRITWLEFGMFLLGLAGSFVLTVLLTFEAYEFHRIEPLIEEQGLAGVKISSRKRAVQRFFAGLKSNVEANAQPNVEGLLSVELAVFHRISHAIDVIGNLLITLGLIGTVMGLTIIMTGLTGSLNALGENQEMLLSGLRRALSGMGTAFYATLLGAVLGGVLLRVFAQITDHGVEGLHDNVMRAVLVHCSADLQPSIDRDMRQLGAELTELGETVGGLEQVLNNSRPALSQFTDEVARLNTLSREQSDLLVEQIRRHRYWCELLREEIRLMDRIGKPWWMRLRDMLRVSRGRE